MFEMDAFLLFLCISSFKFQLQMGQFSLYSNSWIKRKSISQIYNIRETLKSYFAGYAKHSLCEQFAPLQPEI